MNSSWWTYRGSAASSRVWLGQHRWAWAIAVVCLAVWWLVVLPPVAIVRFMGSDDGFQGPQNDAVGRHTVNPGVGGTRDV